MEIFFTPGDFFQQFLQNSFKSVRGTFWGELVLANSFLLKKIGILLNYFFRSKIQKNLSKLQSKCPEEQSQENFFWGENSEKLIEIRKVDLSAFNFVIVYKPAFTTTKRSICGTEKTFLEKTSILFFFVFELEAWNFVFLSVNGSRLDKRAPENNPRKTFSGQQKKKNWHLSDNFPSFRQNRWSGCVKIQHSKPPNEQLAGKKFWEIFSLVYLFSRLEDKISFICWKTEAGCQIVSQRLVR